MVTFNRTFMELKVGCSKGERDNSPVSIAPLWNWKYQGEKPTHGHDRFQSHLYGIESVDIVGWGQEADGVSIAPLWNWKHGCHAPWTVNTPFQSHLYGIESRVLQVVKDLLVVSIAPLWNWKVWTRTRLVLAFMFQSHLYGIERRSG